MNSHTAFHKLLDCSATLSPHYKGMNSASNSSAQKYTVENCAFWVVRKNVKKDSERLFLSAKLFRLVRLKLELHEKRRIHALRYHAVENFNARFGQILGKWLKKVPNNVTY